MSYAPKEDHYDVIITHQALFEYRPRLKLMALIKSGRGLGNIEMRAR